METLRIKVANGMKVKFLVLCIIVTFSVYSSRLVGERTKCDQVGDGGEENLSVRVLWPFSDKKQFQLKELPGLCIEEGHHVEAELQEGGQDFL